MRLAGWCSLACGFAVIACGSGSRVGPDAAGSDSPSVGDHSNDLPGEGSLDVPPADAPPEDVLPGDAAPDASTADHVATLDAPAPPDAAALDTPAPPDASEAGVVTTCTVSTYPLGGRANHPPFLGWTGSDFVAVWINATDYIEGTRHAADGSGAATPWTLSTLPRPYRMSAAWAGTELGVLYRESGGDGLLVRLNADGTVLQQPRRVSGPGARDVLTWNGTVYGAAWAEGTPLVPVFTELDPDGTVRFPPVPLPGPSGTPTVVPGPQGTWVSALMLGSRITFAKIGAAGQVTASQELPNTDPITPPSLAALGPRTLAAYGNSYEGVHVAVLDAQLAAPPIDRLVSRAGDQATVIVRWNGRAFGLAWYEFVQSQRSTTIHFMELDENGAPRSADVLVSAPNGGGDVVELNDADWLVWTGNNWALAWLANRDVNDVRLSQVFCN